MITPFYEDTALGKSLIEYTVSTVVRILFESETGRDLGLAL